MKKVFFKISNILFCFTVLFFVSACSSSSDVASIKGNELFTLNYGNFEDELNLFNLSRNGAVNTFMTMEDGFFYISNGESKKILELNSYGDILSLFYNEEANIKPSFAENKTASSTKKAVSYPLNTLGPVAVDSHKCLYASDTLPQERQEVDVNNRLLLNYVVLRFKSDGTFVDYIGQQGPGGTPFPHIKNIYATTNDELVVVSETNNGPVVFWFNQKGFLLYKIPLTENVIPKLTEETDEDSTSFVSIQKVIPDNIEHKLYIQIDYFKTYLDPATKVQSGIDYDKTVLYPLNVQTGLYEDGLEIPFYEDVVSENLGKAVYNLPLEFLGVTDSGWFFFILPIEKGFLIQMVQPNGQKILKRVLNVNHQEILYYSLNLSGDGIISGLFVKKDKAHVAWWRTDNLVNSIVN